MEKDYQKQRAIANEVVRHLDNRDVRITFTAEIFLSGTEDEIREQFRNMEFFSEKAIKNKADFVSLVSAEDVITNEEIAIY